MLTYADIRSVTSGGRLGEERFSSAPPVSGIIYNPNPTNTKNPANTKPSAWQGGAGAGGGGKGGRGGGGYAAEGGETEEVSQVAELRMLTYTDVY